MMIRKHFFESLEREVNFQNEYIKLEKMCNEIYGRSVYSNGVSINTWIEQNFRSWRKRSNYTSFEELREQLGFSIKNDNGELFINAAEININRYLLFCEMIINVIVGVHEEHIAMLDPVIEALVNTIIATVEKCGMEIKTINDEIMIVEKNAVAIEVADKVPELADIIIEYNHYLLKGDLNRKKELLKRIADALEPERKELNGINKSATDDFFFMVNNWNIRHNNCNPNDAKNYNPKFDSFSTAQKEECYDLVYEQGLALYVMKEQLGRTKKIDSLK